METTTRVRMLMYGKVSQENYVELTAASAIPVSYTHLDVYKRQKQACGKNPISVAAVNMIAELVFATK